MNNMEQDKFLLGHIYGFLRGLKEFFTLYDVCLDSDSLDYQEYEAERIKLKEIADINPKEFAIIASLLYKKLWYEKKVKAGENGGEGYIFFEDKYFYVSRGLTDNGYDTYVMCLAENDDVEIEYCYVITGQFGFFELLFLEDEYWMNLFEEKYGVKLERKMGTAISAVLKGNVISSTYDERLHNWKELADIYYQLALFKKEYASDEMILIDEFNIWKQALKYMQEDGVYPEINTIIKDYICDRIKENASLRMAVSYNG